ncbi:hypothetical protein BJX76DRAFT_359408 [Aspergillus varians]
MPPFRPQLPLLHKLPAEGSTTSSPTLFSSRLLTRRSNHVDFDDYLLKLYKINVIHLFSLFSPLVLKGMVKKVIHITSGHADPNWIVNLPVTGAAGYTLAKAATNITTAKFAAQYGKGKDGVLFINICPGSTDTGNFLGSSIATQKARADDRDVSEVCSAWSRATEDSVRDVLSVIERPTAEKDGGAFVSNRGDQMWLS